MSSGSRWGRKRAQRAEDEYREGVESSEEPGLDEGGDRGQAAPAPERRPPARRLRSDDAGLDGLFAEETNRPDPEADALEAELRADPVPPAAADPADQARDELAALLAQSEAQTDAGGQLPPPPDSLEIERDSRAPTALGREVQLPPPPPGPAPEAPPRRTEPGRGEPGESWDAIESLFTRRLEEPSAADAADANLQLEWERPEMFTEPTQEEILRRITELGHGLEGVEQRVEELARPLGELTEPGTRLAAAFKRLELIERAFEEMRLSNERNTLKTASSLSAIDTSMGELRAAMEEPMWEISERLTSAEIRLTELQGAERLIEQVNTALAKDPFDLVSTRDIDEITDGITTKVKRLGGRVERLEAALDRGLSGLEEARRAAMSAARELNKIVERANTQVPKPARATAKAAPAKKAAVKKAPAKKPAAKKRPAR